MESNREQDKQEKHPPSHRKKYALNFSGVQKLIEEDAQPEIIARKFAEKDTGLKQFLENNSANWDAVELVLVVIGHFCEKKGVVLFNSYNTFIKIVQILAEENVFSNLNSVILNIPKSRCNLCPKNERFRKLIKSLHLSDDGNADDICALKNIPSIRDRNVDEVFSTFHKEGAERLKNTWEQHSKAKLVLTNESHRDAIRFQGQELMIHLKPLMTFDNSNSVIPECEYVCADTGPFLRPNIIKGSYPDVDTYLDIQFRILQDLRVSNSTTENGNNEDCSRSE
ncbi:hypothetical protein DAPPUDRAFT_117365 [Daphnia pulex]|uniref:Uncharacterized protein n=1 Tax=Daphnia pulex TaxID=6669 RepID=E9HSF1_DAPPU|nr:hypothetical protein DAPPUDRAFT_117365 [Daphnia pulex]|eukprot:EFX65333.1 hypothetical protein DAPPUDRAFT_117365 [Daphnia pulex]